MGRLLIVALVAIGIAAAVAGPGAGAPANGVRIDVAQNPFRYTILVGGTPVVTQDATARFRYQLASTGAQYALTSVTSVQGDTYQVATNEPGRTATVSVGRSSRGVHVSVQLSPATDVQQVYDSFVTAPDDHFLGGGQRGDAVDLRGTVLPIKVSNKCSYAPIPFFASSAGWGLRLDSQNVAGLAFPGSTGGSGCQFGPESTCTFPALQSRAEVCVKGARLDEDIYLGSLPQVLAAYQADAGTPRVPAPSELALVKWRDVAGGPDDVLDDVRRFRAAGIPLGWVLLDNPWETCVGSLTFNPSRFPDPAGLIKQVHALGALFMLWISPRVDCPAGYPPSGVLGSPGNQVLDLGNPAVVAEYQRRLRALAALGVDGVKGDRGDEVDLEPLSPSLQNDYPLLFARAALGAFPQSTGGFFRAGTVGSQAVLPGLWAGDQPGDWTGLKIAIRAAQTAAMSGFPVWGSDVGGYASSGLTTETFVRWAQLGAVSPLMEVGGIGPNATPWTLAPPALDALRDAAVLHYELFPYLYDLLRRGQPVLRPLAYGFARDSEAWRADLELLVGPDLLAAPVTGTGTTPSVYLPAGTWIDLYAGSRVAGGQAFVRPTPLTQFPLYVRSGAVLPFNLRTPDSWWGVDELTHTGRAGWLATAGAPLALRGQPRDVQLFVPLAQRPHRIRIGHRRVRWTWNAAPMPGAVVRLHGPTVTGRLVVSP